MSNIRPKGNEPPLLRCNRESISNPCSRLFALGYVLDLVLLGGRLTKHSTLGHASGHVSATSRDRSLYAGTTIPTSQRLVSSLEHWKCTVADWCHYGWVCAQYVLILPMIVNPTECSIHERSAREKISSDQVAHVLNDEVSRKYIQSLKRYEAFHPRRCASADGLPIARLLTFAQTKYPPADVSQLMG